MKWQAIRRTMTVGLVGWGGIGAGAVNGQVPERLSTADIARKAAPATVTILSVGAMNDTIGLGSGFIVRSDGVIVTNWHVLDGAHSAVVVSDDGRRYERVEFLAGDDEVDVAVIKVDGQHMPTLATHDRPPSSGEEVVVIGSPFGLSQTVSNGIVSAVRVVEGRDLLQITAPISAGSSGGPVLDQYGRAVGISTSYIEQGQQLNFAVPVRYATALIGDGAMPQSLASVFGRSDGGRAGSAQALEPRELARMIGTPPERADRPRQELTGSYAFQEVTHVFRVDGTPGYFYLSEGTVHITSTGFGFGLGARPDMPADTILYMVESRWTSDGRVLLRTSSSTFQGNLDGFQTNQGFWVASDRSQVDPDHDWRSAFLAYRAYPPLSDVNGLYALRVQTTYVSGRYRGDGDRWEGEAALVRVGQEVHMIVSIANVDGGVRSGVLRGRLSNGRAELSSEDGRLAFVGEVEGGRLTGEWTDRREGDARFEGTLQGERR